GMLMTPCCHLDADSMVAAGVNYVPVPLTGQPMASKENVMLTLYGFGPYFGMPDGSPHVLKAHVLLRMAGLPYVTDTSLTLDKAPKGKLPVITDAGETIADTTFIRRHVERKYGFDFDLGLDKTERAEAWAVERLLEDHFYWVCLYMRWAIPENFA